MRSESERERRGAQRLSDKNERTWLTPLVAGCIAIKRRIHQLKDNQKHYVILNCFSTVSYSMLPVVYLSLESVGSIVHRSDDLLATYSRDVVKVNFTACLHVVGMACYQIMFAPFSRYKAKDILKGRVRACEDRSDELPRRVRLEINVANTSLVAVRPPDGRRAHHVYRFHHDLPLPLGHEANRPR